MAETAIPIPQTGERRWRDAIWDWVTTVDHKKIGILYIFTAVVFFIVGGIDALLIRTQLVLPENSFLSAQTYNEMFTMHGTTMIFLVIMPLNVGLANYVIPLMLGANDMAFPHLSAFVITVALSVMCVGIVGVAAQAAKD